MTKNFTDFTNQFHTFIVTYIPYGCCLP